MRCIPPRRNWVCGFWTSTLAIGGMVLATRPPRGHTQWYVGLRGYIFGLVVAFLILGGTEFIGHYWKKNNYE